MLFDLVRTLTARGPSELAAVRGELQKLATSAKQPVTRQLGFVALIAADGNVDGAWTLGVKSLGSLQDLVRAMPLLSIRTSGQPSIRRCNRYSTARRRNLPPPTPPASRSSVDTFASSFLGEAER